MRLALPHPLTPSPSGRRGTRSCSLSRWERVGVRGKSVGYLIHDPNESRQTQTVSQAVDPHR